MRGIVTLNGCLNTPEILYVGNQNHLTQQIAIVPPQYVSTPSSPAL